MHTRSLLSTLLRLGLAAVAAAAGLFSTASGGQAADLTLEIDTTLDSSAAAYQACTDAPNDCSLRGAISKANGDTTNRYTLLLQSGATYILTIDGWMEAYNATGDLNIRTGMNLDGRGASIEPQTGDRALRILNGSVTLKNLTIANSHLYPGPIGGSGESGGALYLDTSGTVRLENCILRGNTAGNAGPGSEGSPAGAGTPATNGGRGGSGGNGGAIYVNSATAALILDRVTLENNQAGAGGPGGPGGAGSADYPGGAGGGGGTGGYGGGIYVVSGNTALTLIDTTLRGNRSGDGGDGGPGGRGGDNPAGAGSNGGAGGAGGWAAGGGGIYASAVTIDQSLFYANQAGNAGIGGAGGAGGSGSTGGAGGAGGDGGLAGMGGALRLSNTVPNRITNTTLYQNTAGLGSSGGAGGAGGAGAVTPGTAGRNGTAQQNGGGGGMYLSGASPLYLNFVTITQNAAWMGAGIENHGTLYARNSIIAGNTSGDVYAVNAATPFYSDGYNLFGSSFSGQVASDQVVTNAATLGLLPLAFNGGRTLTAALTQTSPALRFSPCSDRNGQPVTVDQRGFNRPPTGLCDTGAYQYYTRRPVQYLPVVVGE